MHHFKKFSGVKSTQDEKVCVIQGNQLKLTQVELISFFYFKNEFVLHVNCVTKVYVKISLKFCEKNGVLILKSCTNEP